MSFAAIYGTGAAMGFSPQQINEMSLWEYTAAVDGWMKANGASGPTPPEPHELDEWIMRDIARGPDTRKFKKLHPGSTLH